MNKRKIYIYSILVFILFLGWLFSDASTMEEDFDERVKIALREAGDRLLLSNSDSTSLVLPIIAIDEFTYTLSFQSQISLKPGHLVTTVKESFKKLTLPKYYRIAVIQCSDQEVGYSYEIKGQKEKDIIPCTERFLPHNCYTIKVKFTQTTAPFFNKRLFFIALIFLGIIFLLDDLLSKRKQSVRPMMSNSASTTIGSFKFYPEQNKLVRQAMEISLSQKECELLTLFVTRPNQVIKRDELTKKVWEDHGVFVGRSLDTYISKLRKKLKDDDRIKPRLCIRKSITT